MNHSVVRTLKRIAILSVAGAIALSASTMTSPPAFAASPSANSGSQVPLDLQKKPDKNKAGTQPQGQQNGQMQNGQWQSNQPPKNNQNGQAQTGQNGQWQNGQNGQWQNNQNGQWHANQPPKNTQNGQAQNSQNGQWQSNPPPKNGQNGQWQNGQNGQWQNGQNGQWQNGQNGQWQNNQNGQANNNSTRQRYDWSAYRPGHQPPQWQQYHRDFNPHSYQWNRTSNQRYHYQSYRRPYGWYDQRWAYGQILPRLFWSQDYWLTGYYNFGLIDPPYGYVWVQNGNDALLVDVQSGQILSVEYNVFYT